MTTRETARATVLQDPPLARFIFEDTRFAWVWLIVRLYVGYEWVHAGYEKLQSPAWMDGGAALQGFWTRVTQVPPQGQPPITYGWYRDFLTYMLEHGWYTWFAPLVAITETTVGALLILGALTGIAAFLGAFLNFNFMLAGVASINPVLFVLALLLILAWKTAGWYGLDRWLLPALGTPWQPGTLLKARERGRGPEPTG